MLTEGQKHRIFTLLDKGYKVSKIMREMKLPRPQVERQKRIWNLRRQAKEQLGIDLGIKREVALEKTRDFILTLRRLCKKFEVVGSIRRNKTYVRDVDIVCIPDCDLNTKLRDFAIMNKNTELVVNGKKLIRVEYDGVQVDIYCCKENNFGVLKLIRTGDRFFNIKLCQRAKKLGMKLSASDGVIKDGKVIASQTEKEVFNALGLRYIVPTRRDGDINLGKWRI